MARISVKLQGEANAQGLFDVMHGRAACWREEGRSWHKIDFDHESVEAARQHIADMFPKLKFTAGPWV